VSANTCVYMCYYYECQHKDKYMYVHVYVCMYMYMCVWCMYVHWFGNVWALSMMYVCVCGFVEFVGMNYNLRERAQSALFSMPYIPYHTIPYHIISYHTIPYHTTPHHTIPYQCMSMIKEHTFIYNN